jgi:PAS domain S-box-containing protein
MNDESSRFLSSERHAQFAAIVEFSDDAIIAKTLDGIVTAWNAGAEKLYGYSAEEAIGQPIGLHLPADRAGEIITILEKIRRGESVHHFETVRVRKDGTGVDVSLTVSPIRNSAGEVTGASSIARDITERKRVEEALRKSERRFALAFDATPIPTCISEMVTGRILDVNEHFLRTFGHSREEVVGKTSLQLGLWANPADRDRMAARVLREGFVDDEELQALTGSGEIRDVVGSAVPIDLGGLPSLLSTFLDVTRRKRAEKEMRRSEERFRRLFESNTISIVVANLAGETLEANDVYLSMLGYTRDELITGRIRWDQMTPPEHWARDRAAVEQLQRTGVAAPWEKELLRKDGARVPVLIGLAMLGESEGSCIAYIVDLTERRRAEEALRASEERYRRLFESNPQPMWVFDEKTLVFLAVNEAACRHYGYSHEEFLGMTIEDIRPAEDVPALHHQLETESREDRRAGVWRHRKKDGTVIEVEINSNALVLGGREVQLVLATDVTERRLLEQQLRQGQKMEAVGQLAGGIAHDFNNLLTAILGYADLLATEAGEESPLLGSIEEIRKAGERAANLTRQLLAFSRRQLLEPKVLNLNALVSNIEKMLRRLIGDHVELVTALDPRLGHVRADAGQIEQVIMNLVVNARDAMGKGGTLTIETKDVELDEVFARDHLVTGPVGNYVMLAVSDTGVGMSAETKSHIFEPFFTTKGPGKGTGLGLSTVYGIVKQSNGYVWAYSELDRGTTFKVYLPRVEEWLEPAETAATQAGPLRGSETVLLVEDEESVRSLVRGILESFGYEVLEARSGEQALKMVRQHPGPIDLVLSDLVMPEMGGVDLVSRLRALRPEIRVLFMSGYTDDVVVRQGFLDSGSAFLQKPFAPAALAGKVREILER